MLDLAHLFIASALAQTPPAVPVVAPALQADGGAGGVAMQFLPLLLIFAVFYVLLIRPQQKKLDEQAKMIKALTRGDRIITAGGIHGKVTRLEGDDALMVEIANGVEIKVVRSTVQALAAKTEPAADNGKKE